MVRAMSSSVLRLDVRGAVRLPNAIVLIGVVAFTLSIISAEDDLTQHEFARSAKVSVGVSHTGTARWQGGTGAETRFLYARALKLRLSPSPESRAHIVLITTIYFEAVRKPTGDRSPPFCFAS